MAGAVLKGRQSCVKKGATGPGHCQRLPGIGTSIHAPARGATNLIRLFASVGSFQSTHPRGVRPAYTSHDPAGLAFQSTHPRGVRPNGNNAGNQSGQLSIHAPARGATIFRRLRHALTPDLSIHAPARGATEGQFNQMGRRRAFNPRTRAGCDAGSCPNAG